MTSPVFYLAWVAEGVGFNAGTHATTATKIFDGTNGEEIVFSLEISHSEGDFPSLECELINPRVGLLSAGRNLWVWLSADSGSGAEALFHGRVIGVPENVAGEVWRVQFVARPPDYQDQKEALAASLRVLPWFDPVWLQEDIGDPDAVLETYPVAWHIDRTTLAVTTSDIIDGEDGTVEIGEADHFYDDIDVSYGDPPLRRISISGTVQWTQSGSGDIDLTHELVTAFQAAGSPYPYPLISSLTGDGLFTDWPEPLADIGGGWIVAASSSVVPATWMQAGAYVKNYSARDENATDTTDGSGNVLAAGGLGPTAAGALGPDNNPLRSSTRFLNPSASQSSAFLTGWKNWQFVAVLSPYSVSLVVHYDAARERSETVTATIEADVQPLLVDPGAAEEDSIELSSDFVSQEVDDAGSPATGLPIADPGRNSYFKTDRGAQSFEYLLLLARAKLLARARAVTIKVATTFEIGKTLSCRKNVHLVDYRLPGGQAIGKITAYRLTADGDRGEFGAAVEIGSTIGYGNTLPAAATGTPAYVEDGYVEDGYQQRLGAEIAIVVGELQYQSFDDFDVTDDDGVNLLDMRAGTVLNSLTVTNGPDDQRRLIDAGALGLVLNESATITAGLKTLTDISGVTDLVSGWRYRIRGDGILIGATFSYDGDNAGTLSTAATASGTIDVVIDGGRAEPDPAQALEDAPTIVTLDLVPVTGGAFHVDYAVTVSDLMVPQMIDLEAA